MAIASTFRWDADQQILDFLHRRYYPQLKAAAQKRVRDVHVAEDMAQEAFKRAAERGQLADIQSQRSYMFKVMEHLRFELARLQESERTVLKVDSTLASHASEFPLTSPHGMTEVECAVELMRLAEQLSGRRASVFQLALEGHSYADIALKLGISVPAVGQDLMHARQELAAMMNLSGGTADVTKH